MTFSGLKKISMEAMRFGKALFFLATIALISSGCAQDKSAREGPPSSTSSLALSVGIETPFEGWEKNADDSTIFYKSADDNIVIFVVKSAYSPIEATIDRLRNAGVPGFSIDNVRATTIGNSTGQVVDMTSSEPPMKIQTHFVPAGGQIVRVGIMLPTAEQSFLTEPDKWPTFLRGVTFSVE